MEEILDDQTPIEEQSQRQPLIITLFLLAIGIRLFGGFFKINAWPYGSELLLIGNLSIFLAGTIAFFTKAFHPKQGDSKINLYFAFFFIGFIAQTMRYYYLNEMKFPPIYSRALGPFFEFGAVLLLLRYYTRNKETYLSIEVLKLPFLLSTPLMIIGLLFKLQSWPYASEMITLATLLFFILSVISFFRITSSKKILYRVLPLLNIIAANLFYFGFIFKIQSWPFAGELLFLAGFFILISAILHFFIPKHLRARENKL